MNDENTKLETLRDGVIFLMDISTRHRDQYMNEIETEESERKIRVCKRLAEECQIKIDTFKTVLGMINTLRE